MDTRKASELFWVTFAGEYVEIICKYENSEQLPFRVQGYLLDIDDQYYYVGHNPLEIHGAVKKSDVVFINIAQDTDPAVEVLENMPDPVTEGEVN